jgi:nucleotide-binding universal stress UspA family protein
MEQPTDGRPVVVGVSEDQPDLLTYAADMAQMLDAPLRVVHANSFQIGTGDLYEGRDAGNILHEAAQVVIADARKRLSTHTGVEVEYALRTEPPVFAIETESKDAALVVLGADDVAVLQRAAGTDVARRAALRSACPLVVVPPGAAHPVMTEVLVAIDVHNVVEDALGFAFDIADRTGAKLRAVTVLPASMEADELAWCQGRLKGHLAHWSEVFPDVDSRAEVILGDASDELAREALDAQLVVVGHPNQPHRGPIFGKHVASSLLRAAPSAVAVVPVAHES